VRDLGHDRHAKAKGRAGAAQRLRIAPPVFAEMKVVADDHVTHPERMDQHLLDECVGLQIRQRAIEGENDGEIKAEFPEQLQLQGQGRQPEVRPLGLKKLARMRLEHDGAGRNAEFDPLRPRRLEQRPVAPVDAVEVADGQHRAARCAGNLTISVDDLHGRRHRLSAPVRSSAPAPPGGRGNGDRAHWQEEKFMCRADSAE
jgi:hypothetical protein